MLILEFTNTYGDVGRVEIFKNFPPLLNANSLDPGQARHFVGHDLESKSFHTLMVVLKEFIIEVDFEKIR